MVAMLASTAMAGGNPAAKLSSPKSSYVTCTTHGGVLRQGFSNASRRVLIFIYAWGMFVANAAA